ncbi:tail fiber domain-containing protein [Burkholderia sp. LMG 32019]|uniref:tail fiber domain-containing protein n=1 Tax=Burkholderia sp. LMG 32019 TaxID=3158173 RepID=UPI003C2AE278
MGKLQKANLGLPPGGSGGDDQRTANMRFNANVDVLQSHLSLDRSYLEDSAILNPSHAGTVFFLVMKAAGKDVKLPQASDAGSGARVHFVNVGPPVSVSCQPGNGTQISLVNTGDWIKYESDGGTYWNVVERGRVLWNETVGGDLTVGGSLTVARDETVNGSLTINGRLFVAEGTAKAPGIAFLNDGAPDTGFFHISDGAFGVTCNTQEVVRYGPGAVSYSVRPTFGGKVPWDNGNFNPANYAALAADQTFKGTNFFEKPIVSTYTQPEYGSVLAVNRAAGSLFNDWSKAPAVIRVECDNNGAAYQLFHAQKSGQRDLFAMSVHAGGSGVSIPMVSFTFTGTINAHQFYDGGNATFVGSLSQGSDYRIKKSVDNIDTAAAYEGVRRLRFVDYLKTTNVGEDAARRIAGVIAHEAQTVFSNVVSGEKDAVEDDGRLKLQTVDYNGLGVYVGAAVQHMANLIESLTSDVAMLRAEVAMLRGAR